MAGALRGRAGIGDVVARLSVDAVRRSGGTSHVVVRASGTGGLARLPLLFHVVPRAGLDAISRVARARIRVVRPQTTGSLRGRSIGVHVVPWGRWGARTLARLVCPSAEGALSLIRVPVTRCVVSRVGIDAAGLPRLVLPSPWRALSRGGRSGPGVVARRSVQAVRGGVGG